MPARASLEQSRGRIDEVTLLSACLEILRSFEDPENVAINKRVQLHMMDLGDGWGLPEWELADEPSEGAEWQVPGK